MKLNYVTILRQRFECIIVSVEYYIAGLQRRYEISNLIKGHNLILCYN